MKKTTGKKNVKQVEKIEVFTRQELLGDIDKAFTLGDSEIIADRIIEFILKLVENKSRIHFVESLMNDYIISKTMKSFRLTVDAELNFVAPDPENEFTNKDKFEFEVPKSKIDTWASNKAKTTIVKAGEFTVVTEPVLTSASITSQKGLKSFRGSFLPGLKKLDPLFKSSETNKEANREAKELKAQLSADKSSSFISKGVSQSNIYSKSKKVKKEENEGTENAENKKITTPPIIKKKDFEELEQYSLENVNLNMEPVDQLELVRENAFRLYFKEKEVEKERKKKLEMEMEHTTKEMEKKRKKLLEEMNRKPFSYDFEGKIISVKPPDPQKFVYHPQPNTQIRNKDLNDVDPIDYKIYATEKSFTDAKVIKDTHESNRDAGETRATKENKETRENIETKRPAMKNSSKSKKVKRSNESKVTHNDDKIEIYQNFYQPDPLSTHIVPPGVTMDFYGIKKAGGKFPPVPEKFSGAEFLTMLSQFKPSTTNFFSDNNKKRRPSQSKPTLPNYVNEQIISEADEHNYKDSMTLKLTKLMMDSNSGLEENKQNQNNENILKKYLPVKNGNKASLYEIRKKQKKEKSDKIKANKNFNFENFQPEDSEKLYDVLKYYDNKEDNENVIRHQKPPPVLPKHKHVDAQKELGHMKKYPRERTSKEVLAKSGKFKVVQNVQNVNTNTVKNPIKISNNEKIL